MICNVCTGREEKLKLMPGTNLAFMNGSINFRMSSLYDHATTDGHKRAIREQENKNAIAAGLTVAPRKVVQETSTYSAVGAGFKRMGETEKTAPKNFFGIAHDNDVKGQPFTDFKDHIQLGKIHGVRFQSVSYENEFDLIKAISEFIFKKIYTRNFYE